jgi:uncharacterized protein YndB with AHSA1/START domain
MLIVSPCVGRGRLRGLRRRRLARSNELRGDGRTRVVNTSLFHTSEERDGMLHSGMEEGLNQSYVALDRMLAAMA